MNIAKPDMWGKKRFILATTPPVVRKSFAGIDRQLELWDANSGDPARSRFYLGTVIDECQKWIAAKSTKIQNAPTKNVLKRQQKVRDLMRMAFERLRWEAFAERKEGGAKPAAIPLGGGYDVERTQFQAGKRAGVATSKGGEFNPAGGSFVKESVTSLQRNLGGPVAGAGFPPNVVAALTAPFDTLTPQQFLDLHDFFTTGEGALYAGMQTPNVHFMRKDERVQNNMIVAINGLYHRATADTPYTTTSALDMYAMDRYGNLMVAGAGKFHKGMQLNHSSLNAGNEVICAGTLKIRNGKIEEIDNESGHYKPGRVQMNALLRVLIDDDRTDLSFATVRLTAANAADEYFRGHGILALYGNLNARGAAT